MAEMATKTKKKPAKKKVMEVVPPNCDTLLSIEQVCAALNVCRRTFQSLRTAGEFPPHDTLVGKRPRWWVKNVNAWIAARCGGDGASTAR